MGDVLYPTDDAILSHLCDTIAAFHSSGHGPPSSPPWLRFKDLSWLIRTIRRTAPRRLRVRILGLRRRYVRLLSGS